MPSPINADIASQNPGIPKWMQVMRMAAQEVITPEDVKEIVKNQVKRAKEGDRNAIAFVFGQVLGGDQMKGMTLIQHNHAAPIVGQMDLRKIVTCIEAYGSVTADVVVKETGIDREAVDAELKRLVSSRLVSEHNGKFSVRK